VTQLRDPKAVQIYCDDELYTDWGVIGDHSIEINSTIGEHRFRITGTGSAAGAIADGDTVASSASASPGVGGSAKGEATVAHYKPAAPPSCSCC
jgi:hypothetical protein